MNPTTSADSIPCSQKNPILEADTFVQGKPSFLPPEDPKFHYPKSLNPYYDKLAKVESRAFLNEASESMKGKWRESFATPPQTLRLEVCCNGGHVVIERAAKDTKTGYLGLDWKYKQVYRAWEKSEKRGIENVQFIRANAVRLHYLFAPGELDRIDVYFPDPWPKKAHRKNRLLSREWFERIAPLLDTAGIVEIKTDHREYFDEIIEEIKASGRLQIESLTYNLHKGNKQATQLEIPDVTLFEKLFVKDGLPIHQVICKPKNH